MTPGGSYSEVPVPGPMMVLAHIARGKSDSICFDTYGPWAEQISQEGSFSLYTTPDAIGGIADFLVGPDGTLWFQSHGQVIGEITMS